MSAKPNGPPRGGKDMGEAEDDDRRYAVIANHEGQYSIWACGAPIPAGWRAAGPEGAKAECLAYIARVWTDIAPLSVRGRAKL